MQPSRFSSCALLPRPQKSPTSPGYEGHLPHTQRCKYSAEFGTTPSRPLPPGTRTPLGRYRSRSSGSGVPRLAEGQPEAAVARSARGLHRQARVDGWTGGPPRAADRRDPGPAGGRRGRLPARGSARRRSQGRTPTGPATEPASRRRRPRCPESPPAPARRTRHGRSGRERQGRLPPLRGRPLRLPLSPSGWRESPPSIKSTTAASVGSPRSGSIIGRATRSHRCSGGRRTASCLPIGPLRHTSAYAELHYFIHTSKVDRPDSTCSFTSKSKRRRGSRWARSRADSRSW